MGRLVYQEFGQAAAIVGGVAAVQKKVIAVFIDDEDLGRIRAVTQKGWNLFEQIGVGPRRTLEGQGSVIRRKRGPSSDHPAESDVGVVMCCHCLNVLSGSGPWRDSLPSSGQVSTLK